MTRRSPKKTSSWLVKLLLITPLLIALPFGLLYGLFTVYRIQGEQLTAQGEREKAIAAYRTALQFNQNSATTYLKLAQVQQQEEQFVEALVSYQQAFQIEPNLKANTDVAFALKALGDRLLKKSSVEDAMFAYEKAIQLEPFYVEAYSSLGKLLLEQEKWEEAREKYQKVIEIDEKNLEAYTALGDIHHQQQEWQKAAHMYEKALEIKPDSAKIMRLLGETYQQLGLTQKAIRLYYQAISLDPKNGELYNLLGEAYDAQKDITQANVAYEKALQLSPKNAEIYKNLCLVNIKQRQFEEALQQCQQASRLDPALVEAKVYAAEIERGLAIRNNPNVSEIPEQIPSPDRDPKARTKRSIVKIFASGNSFNSIGTGWIIKRKEDKIWIVTNRHVVTDTKTRKRARRVLVEFYSTPSLGQIRRRQSAKIIKVAPQEDWADLAVLEVTNPPKDLKPFTLASSLGTIGLPVQVIGNPVIKGDWVLAKGTVRQVTEQQMMMTISLASGFSGSPVLSTNNQVVGIVSQAGLYCPNLPPTALETALELGCGIAVPVETIKQRLQAWGIL